jgi:tetratricopeptide (TPR) repeat protein
MLIVQNDRLRLASPGDLKFFFGLDWVHWYPLTWLSLCLDRALWGLEPFGYHLTAVLLHALNAALAFLLIAELMGLPKEKEDARGLAAAAFGALLFSLHPLRVESVTWASERSDVLCAAFYLATVLCWARGRFKTALALHAAGLTAKGVGMTVPLVLLIVDAAGLSRRPWPGARRAAERMAPFLALSAAAGLANKIAQDRFGSTWTLEALSVADRLAIGAWNYTHGLAKTLWPAGLMGLYPMPSPFVALEPRFALAGALVVLLSALAWRLRRRSPPFAAAWSAYLVIMAPMAGFIKTGPQLMADRYTYLATLGLAGLAAAGVRRVSARRGTASAILAALLLAALAGATWRRQGDWLDNERFWTSELAKDPGSATARHFLGLERLAQGRLDEAESLVRASVAVNPKLAPARNSLGNILARTGRLDEALGEYREALRLSPKAPMVRHNIAEILLKTGRRDEARGILREELSIHPGAARTRRLLELLDGGDEKREPQRRRKAVLE